MEICCHSRLEPRREKQPPRCYIPKAWKVLGKGGGGGSPILQCVLIKTNEPGSCDPEGLEVDLKAWGFHGAQVSLSVLCAQCRKKDTLSTLNKTTQLGFPS